MAVAAKFGRSAVAFDLDSLGIESGAVHHSSRKVAVESYFVVDDLLGHSRKKMGRTAGGLGDVIALDDEYIRPSLKGG